MKTLSLIFTLLLISINSLLSQTILTGTVIDKELNVTLPYATIRVLGTLQYTISDENGAFELALASGKSHKLQVRYIGYNTLTESIQTTEGNQNIELVLMSSSQDLEEVVVQSTRASEQTVFAAQNFDKQTVNKLNLGQDLPLLLNQGTSIVTSTDAGNGVGYTGIRIRGSDPTRTNVTINGIPVNDAESQGVYWVNMPDLASSTQSIQVQRGVGTSSNGAGAFGASVNIQTSTLEAKPYVELNNSYGSFNTLKNTVKLGTGLINNHWAFDGRVSRVSSDGYIDRAKTNLNSTYFSGAYYGKKDVVKFVAFGGKERTYQAWNGVLQDSIKTNRTYNYTGEYTDSEGNTQYYDDETDNYTQNNYQLHWIRQISPRLNYNIALHYTKGKGYFEQYRAGERLSRYGLSNVELAPNVSISRSDLVRRRWLDNDFGGIVASTQFDVNPKFNVIVGGGYNEYFGDHFGEVIWAQFASNGGKDHEYYRNDATKKDGNFYVKANLKPFEKLYTYADFQVRSVKYNFLGFNNALDNVQQNQNYLFLNPKLGMTYSIRPSAQAFASISYGSKEPNRNDLTESSAATNPTPEFMRDYELGYRLSGIKQSLTANLYYMVYRDQLILSGKINDVGEYSRINVPSSFRRGLEIEYQRLVNSKFTVAGNITLSQNKIKKFTEFIDQYDGDFNDLGQKSIQHTNTDIGFSPNVISALALNFKPISWLNLSLNNKYVGAQYLDNTQNSSRKLNAYFTSDLLISSNFSTSRIKDIQVSALINNVGNALYTSNGYTYGYTVDGARQDFNFLFPQAGINALLGLNVRF